MTPCSTFQHGEQYGGWIGWVDGCQDDHGVVSCLRQRLEKQMEDSFGALDQSPSADELLRGTEYAFLESAGRRIAGAWLYQQAPKVGEPYWDAAAFLSAATKNTIDESCISRNTLRTLDRSADNFKKRKVGEPIDVDAALKLADE